MKINVIVPIDPLIVQDALTHGLNPVLLNSVHYFHGYFAHESATHSGTTRIDPRDVWEYIESCIDYLEEVGLDPQPHANDPRFHEYIRMTGLPTLDILDQSLIRFGRNVPCGVSFNQGVIYTPQPYLIYNVDTFQRYRG